MVNLEMAIKHLKRQDLQRDVWVPDILLHEDDLSDPATLILAAQDRIDGNAVHEPPTVIPVPKSPFFPRHSINLSLVDRLAFHAVIASIAGRIDATLSDSVYSARVSDHQDLSLLRNGRDGWLAWRRAVIAAIPDQNTHMVSTDVTAYFDFVKHEILIPDLKNLGAEEPLLQSLRRMLTEWCPAPNTGIPQGPDASRVLGNFYLGAVDHVMVNVEGVKYFRFMDDIRIVGPSRSAVIAALQVLDQECRRRGLALSTKKTELLVGERAIESMSETELDDAQYAFESDHADETAVRKQLASIFTKACESDGTIKMRWARFALLRLFKMRDRSVLNIVLNSLENFAPLGGLLPQYLHPWLRRHSVKKKITSFLEDADRNTSPYLSCWLMAAMLDVADSIDERWVSYARTIALKKTEPAYHRSVALNVLALGGQGRDIDADP